VGPALALGGFDNVPLADRLVGRQPNGSVLDPDNQFLAPAGDTIEQAGRPMAVRVRPDGRTAVDLTWDSMGLLTVVDLAHRRVLQRYAPPHGVGGGDVSFDGLLYSPDGSRLWAAQTDGLLRFDVAADGRLSHPLAIPLPAANRLAPIPAGLAWAPDRRHLLVTLNGNNTLGILDLATNRLAAEIPVGNAPRDVVVVRGQAYVSNQGGRPATSTDFTNLSFGTPVVADPRDGAASTGTVSQVDLATRQQVRTYAVGLQPTALLASGDDLLVANSNDDSVSVIDTRRQAVAQTFNVNPVPGAPFGSSPNSLLMLDGGHLAVSLGRDNAVAVFAYHGPYHQPAFDGLVPTGWYPASLQADPPLHRWVVASQKGVGSLGRPRTITEGPGIRPVTGRNVYPEIGTVSLVAGPDPVRIRGYTAQVFANNQWNGMVERNRGGGGHTVPVAVPRRIGDPSPIKHVFLLVKENRTYDQVLGDDPRGNGRPAYAQFGGSVTPNLHALARQYPLIDNLYSDGTLSADGHNWLDQAFVNDYIEREFGSFGRSYPSNGSDALAYARSGFIWDDAARHRVSTEVWGEYAGFFGGPDGAAPQGSWAQWYRDAQIMEGRAGGQPHVPVGYNRTRSDIPSLNRILERDYPGFGLQIPDQYRADIFLRDFGRFERDGRLPQLNLLWLPDDHTAGTSPGLPTPAAEVADNDLAVGRIVEAISHSRYWSSSAVFVIEDDSQNGIDHVDGHRNVALIVSPYARRGAVVHDYYSQLNMVRTIEQILGLPPMNQLDLAATPMYDAFTNTPDLTPYTARPNQVPLDTMNPVASALAGTAAAWALWSARQNWSSEDRVDMARSNRDLWYWSTGFAVPFPGDRRVLRPEQVSGASSRAGPRDD
jgi:YVTN family beta-propeller protein